MELDPLVLGVCTKDYSIQSRLLVVSVLGMSCANVDDKQTFSRRDKVSIVVRVHFSYSVLF